MNVNDQRMLDQMQQMAANMMSSLPQNGQNSEAPKTEKGDTFKDMMDKAKDQKVEAPKKDNTVQKKEQPQKAEQTETSKVPVKTDGKKVELTAQQAAMVAAGYAILSPIQPDGTVWVVTVQDENGNPVLPLAQLENNDPSFNNLFVQDHWMMEPTPELVNALEELLQKANDPRSVQDILGKLAFNQDGTPMENKLEIVVSNFETEQAGEQDEIDLDGGAVDAKPLFKDVEAAPMKVGDNFQLDTEEPDMDTQLANTVRFAAQQGLRQIEIKLSPENLGNLTIRLTQAADGTLQVVLHATNLKAANLLSQHLDNLHLALQGMNQGEVRVEVQRGENSQQAGQQFQQADPDGHNRQQQQQQQHRQEQEHSQDFIQRLRLGLFGDTN